MIQIACRKCEYMKSINLLLATFIFFTTLVTAQKMEGVAGFIQCGYMNAPNTSKAFRKVFSENNSAFSNNFFVTAAEGYYRKNKNLFIGEWTFGLQKKCKSNDLYRNIMLQIITGKYGRVINKSKKFWLYPAAGAGASVITLFNYTKDDGKKKNCVAQTLISPTLDVSMNANFLLSKPMWNDSFYLGWILGIHAGYRQSVKNNNWKTKGNTSLKSDDLPAYTNNSFYVTLSFGAGAYGKHY